MSDLWLVVELERTVIETLKPWLEMLGIELYIVNRVELKPEDCPDRCVDYMWRIRLRCRDAGVCNKLREGMMEMIRETAKA